MKISCLVTDDEPIARKGLASYVERFPFFDLKGSCENAIELTAFLAKEKVDLVFLDIEMPFFTGIDWLRSASRPPKVIITTAYENFALQGYELDVLDYLLKPVSPERFARAASKAADYFRQHDKGGEDYMFIKSEGRLEKIMFDDIRYVQAAENYVIIQTAVKKWMTHSTFKSVLESLPDYFLQTHKSWAVNTKQVTAITGSMLYCGDMAVPLSRQWRNETMEKLTGGKF